MAELNDEYIARMEDVLALYERPYNAAEPVVCLDEKPVSLHDEVRQGRPARPGHLAKRDNEYKRCGVANVFAVVEPKAGRHFNRVTPNRSGAQFARVVATLASTYRYAEKIHLVLDNLSTHSVQSLINSFGDQEGRYLWNRFTIHWTPKHGSWLNQAEIELSLLSRQCLANRRIPTIEALAAQVQAWNGRANRNKTQIKWAFTRKAARLKFGYSPKISKRSENYRMKTSPARNRSHVEIHFHFRAGRHRPA